MPAIAIEQNKFLVYEGDLRRGRALWPAPVLSIATVITTVGDIAMIPHSHQLSDARYVFREDSFDPVTRIRRGRLYEKPGTQPQDWQVQIHPAYNEEILHAKVNGGWLTKQLYWFQASSAFRRSGLFHDSAQIALGTNDAYTIWRVVDIERIYTGEDLLTLRAKSALGVLPEINGDAIPRNGRERATDVLDKLANQAYRSEPEAVVDLARSAAQCCLSIWLAEKHRNPEILKLDLGDLAKKLEDELISRNLAIILARMHTRAKPNEQVRHGTRLLRDDDAEFALASVGMLLREIGWAGG